MKVIKRTTYNGTLADLDDVEIEFAYPPNEDNDPLVHRVGDTAIVAYLSHDDSPANPLTDHDCQGHIYTRSAGVVTDDWAAMLKALGLDAYGEPYVERHFDLEGREVTLWDLAFLELMVDDPAGHDDERVQARVSELYPKHWQAIAGPFVVPISYFAERGGCSIRPTTWDGDPDDLPDGVWVADAGAEENIRISAVSEPGVEPAFEAMHAAAVKYAEGVCSEYASWCEGDAWACIVETFRLQADGTWKADPDKEEAVWGYLGIDWAGRTLHEEHFTPVAERLDRGE